MVEHTVPPFISNGALLLDAMANQSRLEILSILIRGEHSVGSLCEKVGLSQSSLSQHLAKLRGAKLVKTRRNAQSVFYSCDNPYVLKILHLLSEFFGDDPLVAKAA